MTTVWIFSTDAHALYFTVVFTVAR